MVCPCTESRDTVSLSLSLSVDVCDWRGMTRVSRGQGRSRVGSRDEVTREKELYRSTEEKNFCDGRV